MEKPYLSIVMASRNDNHGGDLNCRTQACVDSLSEQAERYDIPIEIVMVEWNPPADQPSLHAVIKHDNCVFRTIVVSPEIHARYKQAELFPLYQMIAKNVGIRRAKGRFIIATNVDIFFSNDLMRRLAKKNLEKNLLYRAYRYDAEFGVRSLEGIESKLIRINLSNKDELCTNACGDFQMMHRDNWNELRGYYEGDLFSIHLDSVFEYHAHYHGFVEYVFNPPAVTYHVEHDGGWVPGVENLKNYNRMNDTRIKKLSYQDFLDIIALMAKKTPPFRYNNESWGLAGEALKEYTNEKSYWLRKTPKDM
ncbi:MAG TPA: hypothetical protein VMY59_04205 [Candidatus Thermoplasmatota archaeon]|nr:hypothetical protein [Candidatus Thermoplasmatota archaeon]